MQFLIIRKGPCNENLPGAGYCNASALRDACSCPHYLSNTAVPCVRGHRLHPDSRSMRDGGALVPAQIIPADFKDGALLLSSGVLVQSTFSAGTASKRCSGVLKTLAEHYFSQQDHPPSLRQMHEVVEHAERSSYLTKKARSLRVVHRIDRPVPVTGDRSEAAAGFLRPS